MDKPAPAADASMTRLLPSALTIGEIVAIYQAGRFADALAHAEIALAVGSGSPALLSVAAASARSLGQYDLAEDFLRIAIRVAPTYPDAHNNLGNLLKGMRRFDEAEASYRRAVAIQSDYVEPHHNLGSLLKELKRFVEAEAFYRKAIAIRPDYADAHNNLGNVLWELNRLDEAEAFYRKAIAIRPDHADAHNNLGTLLQDTKRFEEADASYRQAIAMRSDHVEAHNNLGALLKKTKHFDEAETSCRQAIAIRPGYVDAHNNLGNVLKELDRCYEAEDSYRQAISIRPDHADSRWNLSLLLLCLGRFEEGWPLYEVRYDPGLAARIVALPMLPFPRWQGEPLAGKSLLLVDEQGFGDVIQFIRYAPLLKAMGTSSITLTCWLPLADLLRTVSSVDAVIPEGEGIPPHDYWVFLLSLPGLCGTTLENIPASLPYLSVAPRRIEAWRPRLPATGFRVGLVWKGRTTHTNDVNRSLPGLETLAPLWEVPGVSFISLQKGAGEEEAASPPPGQALVHLGSAIEDFADTAAIVSQLDLVICVDTAVAHLAGALGKPCWVMLPHFGTDWRWLLERTDSPWYPGVMRLFRQGAEENWGDVVATVAGALRGIVGTQGKR